MTRLKIAAALLFFASCAHQEKPTVKTLPDYQVTVPAELDPVAAASLCKKQNKWTFVLHGGVGYKANAFQKRIMNDILIKAHQMLAQGRNGLDVVQYALEQMEDSGHFNAGRGGTRTSAGTVELDSSIMSGIDLTAGAVASVKDVKNPVRLARLVKDKTRHVLLVSEGASKFAQAQGLEKVVPDYFLSDYETEKRTWHYGTVGAVAFDRCGDLAAATSTGGLFGKMPGRVGDSPIIGAGTYANNKTCAISATGEGEKFIRANVATRISNILQYTKRDIQSAVKESLGMVEQMKGDGGLIAITAKGVPFIGTTTGAPMVAGIVQEDGKVRMQE